MKKSLSATLWVYAVSSMTACTGTNEPNADVLGAAMHAYLAQRGDLCLAKNVWPIDVTQREIDVGARNALQMPVLERLGLVVSTVAEIDVDDEGTLHHMKVQPKVQRKVRRYVLTDAGRKYYVTRASAKNRVAMVGQGDFCAARLSLDHIVGWEMRKAANSAQRQAIVTYTYRIASAPWTQDAEIQKVFPVVANLVRGAGKLQLQETFSLTDAGWVAVDLQGS